jgi:hypothetical protein
MVQTNPVFVTVVIASHFHLMWVRGIKKKRNSCLLFSLELCQVSEHNLKQCVPIRPSTHFALNFFSELSLVFMFISTY